MLYEVITAYAETLAPLLARAPLSTEALPWARDMLPLALAAHGRGEQTEPALRITSYNVCYTKLLRAEPLAGLGDGLGTKTQLTTGDLVATNLFNLAIIQKANIDVALGHASREDIAQLVELEFRIGIGRNNFV